MSLTNKITNKKKAKLERKRLRELERRKLKKLGQLCQDSDEDEDKDESMELVRKKLDDCDIASEGSLIYAPRDGHISAVDALIYF